ncbi:MAG: HNH endonuclease [Candidatus Neomarinimicrobiota bacterium]
MEYCVRCKSNKKLSEMVPDKRAKRGHQGYCKQCDNIAKKQYRQKRSWERRKADNFNILNHRRTGKCMTSILNVHQLASFIKSLWENSNHKCYYCGCDLSRDGDRSMNNSFEIDHIIPGVFDELANFVACCRKCNILKNANTLKTLKTFVEKIEAHISKNPHLAAKTRI